MNNIHDFNPGFGLQCNSYNPGYFLTQFERDRSIRKADGLETFGNLACGLLHRAFGTQVKVSKVEGFPLPFHFDYPKMGKDYGRIMAIALFILTFPVSIPLTIVGVVSLRCSESYNHLFNEMIKIKELDPYQNGCATKQEALEYLIYCQFEGANLSHYHDLTNEDLENLAIKCPILKSLKVNGNRINKISDSFKNLEILECGLADPRGLELPKDSSKLNTLKLEGVGIKNWPQTLENLKTLYIFESWTNTMPDNLYNLKLFNHFNTPHFKKGELEKLPFSCNITMRNPY